MRVAGPELPRRVTLTAMTTAMRTVLPSIDGDYLGLEGSECPVDVIDALGDVLGPRSAWNQDGFLIRHEGLCVEVVLDDAPDTDPVSDTGTPAARLAIADLPGDRLARRGYPRCCTRSVSPTLDVRCAGAAINPRRAPSLVPPQLACFYPRPARIHPHGDGDSRPSTSRHACMTDWEGWQ